MNPYDFQLLSWNDNLSKLSIYQLAMWIRDQSRKAYDGLQINRDKVICLYDEWGFLYRAENAELPEDFPAEDRKRFFENQEVLRSRNYRKAIMLLHRPLPNYQYLPKNGTHYEPIPVVMWNRNPEMVIETALGQVEDYLVNIERILFYGKEAYPRVEKKITELSSMIQSAPLSAASAKKIMLSLKAIKDLEQCSVLLPPNPNKAVEEEMEKIKQTLRSAGIDENDRQKIEEELGQLERLLGDLQHSPDEYRHEVREALSERCARKPKPIKLKFAPTEKEEIARAVTGADKLTFYFNELDLGLDVEICKLGDLETFGISRTHVQSFVNERCDKYTLIRFCFALDILGDDAELFLQKEGFSLEKSIRPIDKRIYSILVNCGDFNAFMALLTEEKAKK